MLAVPSIVERQPKLCEQGLPTAAWRQTMQTIKSQPLHTGNGEVVSVEGMVTLFVRLRDLHICAWIG